LWEVCHPRRWLKFLALPRRLSNVNIRRFNIDATALIFTPQLALFVWLIAAWSDAALIACSRATLSAIKPIGLDLNCLGHLVRQILNNGGPLNMSKSF